MRILITGGAGFIGSRLSKHLLEIGSEVVVIDNLNDYYDPAIKKSNIQILSSFDSFSFYQGDIRSVQDMDNIFSNHKIEMVVHLAAQAGVRPSIQDPKLYYEVNVIGTLNILETMRKYGCKKMIFGSSSSVYGNNKTTPFSEDHPVDNPISPYAATKKSGELLCYNYHHLYNFDIFCLR
jgi:UDP-glucuronate 4-epimerase